MGFKGSIIFQAVLLLIQIILYFGCEKFQKEPHDVEMPIDKKIPVIPLFSLIYILWFPLIALYPVHLGLHSAVDWRICVTAWIIDIIVSIAVYMIYPTTFTRPDNVGELRCGWMLKVLYFSSYKGVNCMPSMHCSLSFLILLSACLCTGMPVGFRIIYIAVAAGIIISTLYTKQHVVIDAVTGVILGAACYGAGTAIAAVF